MKTNIADLQGDLTTHGISIRTNRLHEEVVELARKVTPGALVRVDGVLVRTTGHARRRPTSGGSRLSAPIMHVDEDLVTAATTYDLHCEVGDIIAGDITGKSLPMRVRVTRIVARDYPVIEGGVAYWATIVEGIAALDGLTPRRDPRGAAA